MKTATVDPEAPRSPAAGDPGPSRPPVGGGDRRTRERVRELLAELGPSTVAVLGDRLGLTPAAVRRHLDVLVADGQVAEGLPRPTAPRGRGRPAREFGLTERGHAAVRAALDAGSPAGEMAAAALDWIHRTGGDPAVAAFARARAADLTERYRPMLAALQPQARPEALARVLTQDGYAARTGHAGAVAGVQLCQRHCPVHEVAARYPQLCEAETEAFGQLLGTHVARLATIAHGDGVCTTHVPAADALQDPVRPAGSTAPARSQTSPEGLHP